MNTRENLAYDLSLFEPKEKVPFKRQTKVKIVPNPKTKHISILTMFKWSVLTAVVVLSIVSILLSNVKLITLTNQVNTAQTAYSNAKSAETMLNLQLESRMSLGNVQNYAVTKLGLQKVQSYQIVYINLASSDKVVVNTHNSNEFLDFFNNILEYFK
jgi:hypothetical protein